MENKDLSYEKKLAILLSESERVCSDEHAKPIATLEEITDGDQPLFFAESLADSWNENLAMSAATVAALKAHNNSGSVMMPALEPRSDLSAEGCSEDVLQSAMMIAAECRGVYAVGLKPIIGRFGVKNGMLTGDKQFDKRSIAETFIRPLDCFGSGMAPAVIYDKTDEAFGLPELVDKVFQPKYRLFSKAEGRESLAQILKGRRVLKGDVFYAENAYSEWLKADERLKTGAISEDKVKQLVERNEVIDRESIDNAFDLYEAFETEKIKSEVAVFEDDVLRQVAEESVVMLKNNNRILPIASKKKIAVVGNCDADGLKTRFSSLDANVAFYRGYDEESEEEVLLAKEELDEIAHSDIVLFFIDNKRKNGRKSELPSNRLAVLDAISLLGKKIIAVAIGKNPLDMSFDDQCEGVLLARASCKYLGNALADILFGFVNPTGKLAVSYYDNADDFFYQMKRNRVLANTSDGTFFGYRYYSGSGMNVKYPFGYGLSYVNAGITVTKVTNTQVRVRVSNDTGLPISETIQVYIGANKTNPQAVRPQKRLIAFKKVKVDPNDSVTVEIPISKIALQQYSVEEDTFKDERGEYRIWVGTSSRDQRSVRTIKMYGGDAPENKKKATEIFSWKSNIKSDGYYIEDGENLMKNSKKLSMIATAMIIATVLIDACFAIMWMVSGLPFGFSNATSGIALSALILNHIILIAGIVVLTNVKKRNKEVEKLLEKLKKEKYTGATVLKDDSAKQIFKNVEVPADDDKTAEESAEEDSPVFAFNSAIKTEDIYTALRTYMGEKGLVVQPDDIRAVIAAFSASRLIIVNDIENRKAVVEAAAEYFAQYTISVPVGNRSESELFTGESFSRALDYAATNRDRIVVCEFTGVNDKNCRLFEKMLSCFNSAEDKKQLYFGLEQKPVTVTSNIYMVLVLEKGTGMSAFSQELLACSEWLAVGGELKEPGRVSKYEQIGYNQLKMMTEAAENKTYVTEEVWKLIDKFEKDVVSLSFTIGNKNWQTMEKYAAMFVSAGGDEKSMLDYLVAEKFVPVVSLLAKSAGETDGVKARFEDAFGDENTTKISTVLNEFASAFSDENGAKTGSSDRN